MNNWSDFNTAGAQPADATGIAFCTGYGQHDTHAETLKDGRPNPHNTAGKPYGTITGREIAAMVKDPPSVPKERAQWIVPSTYAEFDARAHEAQKEHGQFWFLTLDVDGGNLELQAVVRALDAVAGKVAWMIYATRGSTEENRKWRALVPLARPLTGADFHDTQTAFFDLLEDATDRALIPDRTLRRPGQLVYLPNRGAFYDYRMVKGPRLDLASQHPITWRREETRHKRAEAEAEAARWRERRRPVTDEGASVVDQFNAAHDVATLLEAYEYTRAGASDHWRSPYQTSGSYGTEDRGDHWISLSESDHAAGIGRASKNGARFGDAFDLFCHFDHGGDMRAAVKAYAEETGQGHRPRREQAEAQGLRDLEARISQTVPPYDDRQKPNEPAGPLLQDSAAFCAARTPADYLIDGSVRDGWLYTLTAPTGHGKSAVALAMAYAVAKGGFLGSREVKQGAVLFLAGENADDIRERWIAMCEKHGDNPADLPVVFMPGVWDLRGCMPMLRERFKDLPLRLVIVDTLAAFFGGDNENDNAQQQDFATHVLRPLTELPGRPTTIVPAHPTKGAGKDSLTPKGGSSLLNAVDGNLSAWNTDGTIKVHWQGKFRGAPWAPMHFELSEYQSDKLRDNRGRIMPTIIARAMMDSEISKATEQGVKVENQVLKLLSDGLTVREIADDVHTDGQRGISKSRVDRVIQRLAEQKWIAKVGRKWALTNQGLAVLQQAGEDVDPDA